MSIFGGGDKPPDPKGSATAPGGGRQRRPGSPVDPITGVPVDEYGQPLDKAVPRGTGGPPKPTPPPATAEATSASTAGAQSAAERQRKRAAAGLTLLHGGLRTGPRANLKAAALIGG